MPVFIIRRVGMEVQRSCEENIKEQAHQVPRLQINGERPLNDWYDGKLRCGLFSRRKAIKRTVVLSSTSQPSQMAMRCAGVSPEPFT